MMVESKVLIIFFSTKVFIENFVFAYTQPNKQTKKKGKSQMKEVEGSYY